ncbi:GHKL domain-containing protein [Romboutsia sp. 1001216sp1]|uniref:ATP-binding protein n=1 Tax=unclassified Romboutsia TaxID=2626894 RepID=UPI00189CB8F4|nr:MULTISPECIES: sensor histidine kinase [unclassified Romboutsia]MDB8794788.1 GHKL domain-containing protein [Romboutsia sp. 1001216sp1]MDB8797660.1 GHKL domain-containing protein [Romboutsia sp. 1001216sp1]MDB8800488.1 GHKL domain-containing protein [Romboutsia sp. 1001216sp1]MDB8803319.1 GHKL domain-containing protein [Romboutsia sp. 1001216sp1]MDB8814716.1 GHKL domain-containing protein [Romboutsia sp. 1001216sp1]
MLNSIIFWKLLDIFILILEWISLYILVNDLSTIKVNKKQSLLSFSLILGIAFSMNIFGILPDLRLLISIVLSIFYFKLNYEVNLSKAFIIPLVYWLMLIGIDALSISGVVYINDISVNMLLDYNLYRLEAIILAKSFLLIGILVLKYFKLSGQISKNDFIYVGIPICTNILSLLIIFKMGISKLDNFNLIFISFFILLSSISLLIIIYKITMSNKLKIENEFMKEKIDLEYRYYKKIEENQESIKRIYHDMKNHMICISNLSNEKDVKEYINSLDLKIPDINFKFGNKILDIIINEKYQICKEKGVKFDIVADFSNLDFIDMMDLCVIFSNALDNAIEACDKILDESISKYISINVTYINSFCFIKIENSKVNDINIKNNNFITNKKDKSMHGIGLKNIKDAVNKYDGNLNIEFDDDKFLLKIIFSLKN